MQLLKHESESLIDVQHASFYLELDVTELDATRESH
jgi:hypothetical protein